MIYPQFEETDRYVKLVVQLTRLTAQGVIEWTQVRESPGEPTPGAYAASYNGRYFLLRPREQATEWVQGKTLPDEAFNRMPPYRHVLFSAAQDGSDEIIFPPMQAIDNLVALLKGEPERRTLDDLERALGVG